MDCYLHPGKVAAAQCVACGQPICEACREDVAGHGMCRPCVAATQARLASEPGTAVAAQVGEAVGVVGDETSPAARWAEETEPAAPPDPEFEQPDPGPKQHVRPGIARRLVRGLLWGAVYGQWWTLLRLGWEVFWGISRGDVSFDFKFILFAVLLFVVFGFFGSLAGLVIGAANASIGTGAAIGIGVGLVLCLLEAVASHDSGALINIVFYFFTGRYVGARVTWRVHQPVRRKMALEGV